ncbi:MAG: hypothetical protein JWN17_2561 [Frankiales bacterium]|nr:hypothetical protein [Frankiales bacterium]
MPAPPAPGLPPRHAPPAVRRPVRSTHLVGGLAVLVALWLGVTAPSTSPVSAVPSPVTTTAATTATTDQADGQADGPDLDRARVTGRAGDRGRSGGGR